MSFDSLQAALLAAERGAASVYHAVLNTGVAVIEWETEHPAVKPLLLQGLSYANAILTRAGLAGTTLLIAEDVLVALQHLVARDATVPSVATMTTTTIGEIT